MARARIRSDTVVSSHGNPERVFEMMTATDDVRVDDPADDATGTGDDFWTPPSAPPPAAAPSTDSRNLGALAHLSALITLVGVPGFVGPLAVWLWQRERDPFAAEQARQALNFNLSLLIYVAAGVALSIVTIGLGLLIVVPATIVLAVGWLVLTVLAAIRAADGHPYRYPLTLELVH